MRCAVTENGVVVNVILWDGVEDYTPDEGREIFEVPDEVGIGWVLENGSLVPPPPPPDGEVPVEDPTVLQAKLSSAQELVAMGVTEATARTIVGLPPLA